MDNDSLKQRAEEEKERLYNILEDAEITERRREILKPIILNVAWMKAKLDDAREAIKQSNVVIPYDNGGNQKGIRINPLFTGYESLWKSYLTGMSKILDYLPKEEIKEQTSVVESPKTILELVRDKHKKNA